MDWFLWLSKTNLDPTLSYKYGLVLARNKLQREDLPYFDHQFLQSMGISVAKHRLEILKLAKKEAGADVYGVIRNKGSSKIFSIFEKTKRSVAKWIQKWVLHGESVVVEPVKEEKPPVACRGIEPRRGGALVTGKLRSEKELGLEKLPVIRTRRIAKSGPLDGRGTMQEKMRLANRSLKLSGPLDRSVQERLVLAYRSPVASGPLDGRTNERLRLSRQMAGRTSSPRVYTAYKKRERFGEEDRTLWAALFQDLKPT